METIEHEPSKDDSEVEITDLHPHSEEQQAEAETPISPQTASDPMKRIDRRKERIWLHWRFVMIAGIFLLLVVAMLPIFPSSQRCVSAGINSPLPGLLLSLHR